MKNPTTTDLSSSALPQEFDLPLLSNFVHQVINPLNGVAGTLSNLAEGRISDPNRQRQRLQAARAQIEQCITLMRNLAFLAQGSGGVADSDRRVVILPQTIIEAAMFFQEQGETRKIRIALIERADQNRVKGHPELIKQVLMNIFDNCIKYGKFGSEIEVHQWIQSKTSDAIITIKGISERPLSAEDLPQIFNLGYRGLNARQIVASGTGLGLHICREVIEKWHGGSLTVQRSGIDGLEFSIRIPGGIEA
jgi:Osmosensitive K+ channel histidine kinase